MNDLYDYKHLFGDCSKCGAISWDEISGCYDCDDNLSTIDAICINCGHKEQIDMNNLKEPEKDLGD